ncbi:MAG: hypothetical protein KKD77_21640 [Gammaproteobacteria bacterium]|nr:hypothetical protein [Gammaproteobacteria bacterium]
MTQTRTKRTLDKDLPLEERKRKLAPILNAVDLTGGQSLDDVLKVARETIPAEERDKWHITTDEDNEVKTRLKVAQGYIPVKDAKGKQFNFKGDLLWKIPQDVYEARLLRIAYESNQVSDQALLTPDADDSRGEDAKSEIKHGNSSSKES